MSARTAERTYVTDRYDESVRAMGFGYVWDHLATEDNATSGMLRGILGALSEYLRETGYTPPST